MININFKNIAHAVKEWAIRFFSVYFFIYALLITFLAITGNDCYFTASICLVFLLLNTFLKTKLKKNFTYINIGFKYAICLIIFLITYLILSIISKNILNSFVFIFSVLALFGIKETCMFLVEWINKFLLEKDKEVEPVTLGKTFLSKIITLNSTWDKDEFESDEVSKMLYEFINISNDNQMGHVVVRSMTTTDENNVQKLYVKAKNGYHIILKGKLNHIVNMCSDIISEGALSKISDETVNLFNEKLNGYQDSDKVFCAFKEVQNLEQEEDNNYILAGCGVFENEVIETPVKKKIINISPVKSYNVINDVFLLLISNILLTANIFASVFEAFVFNSCEILTAGLLCSLFAVVVSFYGNLPTISTKNKCVIFASSVICVCVAYFLGRYIMLNGEYENDLFYNVTANLMSVASLVCYVMLILLTVATFDNIKSRAVSTVCCFLLLAYMFVPVCCKLMVGYNISYIYISTAYLISLIGVFISSIFYFILRKKDNGTEISN